jgi:hypothetical protein
MIYSIEMPAQSLSVVMLSSIVALALPKIIVP